MTDITDADFDALTEEANSTTRKWLKRLGLDTWKIDQVFYRGAIPEFPDACAVATPNWEYMMATIRVSLATWEPLSELDREEVLVHELMHLVLSGLGLTGKRKEERTATHLARAFLERFS